MNKIDNYCFSELIGYIDAIEALKDVPIINPKYKLFKFIVNNGMGRRIKVACWGSDATKWSSKITTNKVCKKNYEFVLQFPSLKLIFNAN